MKAVILAGGLGTRLSEETSSRPKPMIEVGGKPLLWHIIKMYSQAGINEFIICLGYKGQVIKHYFANYFLLMSDVTFDMKANTINYHNSVAEPWKITLVDTGEETMTGGRIKAIKNYVKDDELFCLTYGDGISDLNISDTIAFHRKHKKLATVTSYEMAGRFGRLGIEGDKVKTFQEKPHGEEGYISAGFFVLSPKVIDYIEGPETIWEKKPLETLAKQGDLMTYKHPGFWHCIDTQRDLLQAEKMWDEGKAPWKTW